MGCARCRLTQSTKPRVQAEPSCPGTARCSHKPLPSLWEMQPQKVRGMAVWRRRDCAVKISQKKKNPKPPTNRGLFSVTAWKRRAPSPLVLGFSLMSKIWRGVGILPGMHTLRTTALQNCLKTIASAGVGANLNSQFCP